MPERVALDLLDPAGGSEGDVATIVGGEWAPASPTGGGGSGTTALIPLIAVVDGEPTFVFDADHSLVMTEVPL